MVLPGPVYQREEAACRDFIIGGVNSAEVKRVAERFTHIMEVGFRKTIEIARGNAFHSGVVKINEIAHPAPRVELDREAKPLELSYVLTVIMPEVAPDLLQWFAEIDVYGLTVLDNFARFTEDLRRIIQERMQANKYADYVVFEGICSKSS
jgi:hypothetical protein